MDNKNKVRLFCIFVVLIISACGQSKPTPQDFITKPICQIPCWENITPGISTRSDVEAKVQNSSVESINEIIFQERENIRNSPEVLFYQQKPNSSEQSLLGEIIIKDDKVMLIGMSGDLGLTIEEAIALYGTPDEIVYTIENGDKIQAKVCLLFHSNGLILSYLSDINEIKLDPNQYLNGMYLYDVKLFPQNLFGYVFSKEDYDNHRKSWGKYLDGIIIH
jgi:hypothetical protein